MRYGARNQLKGKVTSVKKGDVMSLVKFEVTAPAAMASVLTTESLEEQGHPRPPVEESGVRRLLPRVRQSTRRRSPPA